jgi:hypothetical protein
LAGAFLAVLGLLCGCASATKPEEFFQLSPESPKYRAAQTRFFETSDEDELLSASAAVLQDLGFQIEESVREVGFLRAAKERSAREYGQSIKRILVLVLTSVATLGRYPVLIPIDLHQKIAASMITRPVDSDASRHEVRIMFYRVVWKGEGAGGNSQIPPGDQKMAMIRDPVIYQQFFAKLSKAVFLEAHKI